MFLTLDKENNLTFTLTIFAWLVVYSKICVKRPLKNRQNKDWYLNAGRKYCIMLQVGAFCNTFDLH